MNVVASIVAAALALAAASAPPADPRVQLLPYETDQVVNLTVDPGYAAVIELATEDAIESIVLGNSPGWQITPTSSNDRIIVKPLADAVTTDMIVITPARRYVFLLQPGGASGGLFVLRFTYPTATPAPVRSATYKLAGTRSLFPRTMHDDGMRTTISWPEQTPLPAVFAVGEGGKEAIVDGRVVRSDYVIEGTARKYVFRLGNATATASRKPTKIRK